MKLCFSGFRFRHKSFRLHKSQSALISFITADFFVIKLPPFLSCDVRAQLKSPPIIIVSCTNSSSCLLSFSIEESGLLGDVIRSVDVNKNKSLFFKYHFKIMNLPCVSGMHFSTLKSTEGLISVMTSLL